MVKRETHFQAGLLRGSYGWSTLLSPFFSEYQQYNQPLLTGDPFLFINSLFTSRIQWDFLLANTHIWELIAQRLKIVFLKKADHLLPAVMSLSYWLQLEDIKLKPLLQAEHRCFAAMLLAILSSLFLFSANMNINISKGKRQYIFYFKNIQFRNAVRNTQTKLQSKPRGLIYILRQLLHNFHQSTVDKCIFHEVS